MYIYFTMKETHDHHGQGCDTLEQAYIDFFKDNNLIDSNSIFLPIPNRLDNLSLQLKLCPPSLLIFTGGNNLKTTHDGIVLDDLAPRRDKVEAHLYAFAKSNLVPVLGICRGFQHINVLEGGNMTFFLSDHKPGVNHKVLYQGKSYIINSYHNHGVYSSQLSKNLEPIVFDANSDLVEAFCGRSTRMPVLGVQWHPERPGNSELLFDTIFKKFFQS